MRREPMYRIPKKGLTVWRLYGMMITGLLILVGGIISFVTYKYEGPSYIYFIIIGVVLLIAFTCVCIFPNIRWKHWRYEVSEHEIEIQSGLFIVKKTLIPMVRVQHVDTTQGPILKKYDLSNISISTAATTHVIPMLNTEEADQLRARISELARVAEDDV